MADQQGDDDARLVRAVHDKKPVPEIDFTLHTMEDGTQVTTNDRVCKGVYTFFEALSDRTVLFTPRYFLDD
jgi:hypothetical protein